MRQFGVALLLATALVAVPAAAQEKKIMKEPALAADSLYALSTKTLDGKPANLKDYAGKVSLVINLASQ